MNSVGWGRTGFSISRHFLLALFQVPLGSALLHWGVLTDFRNRSWHCPPEEFVLQSLAQHVVIRHYGMGCKEILPEGSNIIDAKVWTIACTLHGESF